MKAQQFARTRAQQVPYAPVQTNGGMTEMITAIMPIFILMMLMMMMRPMMAGMAK